MTRKLVFIAFVVSLGGFLFGFDAGIISGVMVYAGPEFALSDWEVGLVTSSPSLAAMFAMIFAGRLSDSIGRKPLLVAVAVLYLLSAQWSAFAQSYETLVIARMIGGLAFGAALILAPIYIAEISTARDRGKLVAIQQLNIVLGFFAAFLSNYFFNEQLNAEAFTRDNVWRYMLGVEMIPAAFYLVALFFVPRSPRWLYLKNYTEKAQTVIKQLHGKSIAQVQITDLEKTDSENGNKESVPIKFLFSKTMRYIMLVGLTVGILQQITGINAIYFYATSIFKQTGIGTDAAFSTSVLLAAVTVAFTLISMYLIDRVGRRPLLLVGTAGIAVSLFLCSYGFATAEYELDASSISSFEFVNAAKLSAIQNTVYDSDVEFKQAVKEIIGDQEFATNDGAILETATRMNAMLVLIGILGFIACFAFSLGPVMWVLLSELFPLKVRGLAIGAIALVNSAVSYLVQLIFPWELNQIGGAMTFLIFGSIAFLGWLVMIKILPETKGKTLEELELKLSQQS